MRKNYLYILLLLLVAFFGGSGQGKAQVGPPPVYQFPAPPSVAVIPGTYVYVVPNTDILFYEGYWYRLYSGAWYWAPSYNGPWAYLPPPNVPSALLEVPPQYSYVPPDYPVIPYVELHRNWSRWEQERHWDRDRQWREGWHRGPAGRDRRPEERYGGPRPRPEERHGTFRGEGRDGFDQRSGAEGDRGDREHESHGGRRGW
jgi:hypothetical protein